MKRSLKHSIQRFAIGAASFGLAISVIFPSAAFANSSLESSDKLLSQEQSLNVSPKNYAGISTDSAPVTVIVELSNIPVNVYESEAPASTQRSIKNIAVFKTNVRPEFLRCGSEGLMF